MEMRPGARNDIVTSDTREELSVLLGTTAGVEGETFRSAQPVLAAKAFPERDGRVRINLVPEIQHGENRLRQVVTSGVLRLESGRMKRVFEDMAIEAVLAPGQMLLVGTLPARSGSLGNRFFTQDSAGQLEQKLMILRVAQTQHDELLDSPDVLPLDEALSSPPGPAPAPAQVTAP